MVLIMPKKIRETLSNRTYVRMAVNFLITVAFFGVYIYLCGWKEADPKKIGIAVIILYIVSVIILGVVWKILDRSLTFPEAVADAVSPIGSGVTLDVLTRFRQPVLICDNSGKIIWYNRVLSHRSGKSGTMYGRNISSFCDADPNDIISAESNDGLDVSAFGTSWNVNGYHISAQNKNYILLVWHDKTELENAYKRLADDTTVVAYIMIDNLEELMKYVQEKYRTASGEIEAVLKEWAKSVNGILMDYERDRYFFIFNAKSLESFVESRFDILDRVRETRVGEGNLPVTLSIGVSSTVGTFAEKDSAARSALDMALQRGGDQAAVRTANGLEYYGGRSKGVQKRTKVRARVVANELASLISQSKNVLIMGHKNMDFDALGGCVGLARMCIFCGVDPHIIINPGNRNLDKCFDLLKTLPEYSNIFVTSADAQEMMGSETLLIITDVNNPSQFEAPEVADNAFTTVIIDHHRKTIEFKTQPAIAYIEPSASSCCELISEILEQSLPAGQMKPEEANIMFAGILLDTKQFARNTGTRTFSAALYLRSEGADPTEAQTFFKTDFYDYVRESRFASNLYMYRDIFAIAVNKADDNTQSDRIAAARSADKLLDVDGVAASFVLYHIGSQTIISGRSTGTVNVQLIVEKLGGGGHFESAATSMENVSVSEAFEMLKNAIDEYMEEQN